MKLDFIKQSKNVEQWGPVDMKPLYPSFWFGPMSGTVKSKWGVYWASLVGIVTKDKGVCYWEKKELERNGKASIKRWLMPSTKRNKVIAEYYWVVKKLQEVVLKAEKASGTQKEPFIAQWYAYYQEFWHVTDIFEVANYAAPVYLRHELKKYIPEESLGLALEVLLAPESLSFFQQSEKELLECRVKASSPSQLRTLLEKYSLKWHWIHNSYFESVYLDANYFYKKIHTVSKAKAQKGILDIQAYSGIVKEKKRKLVREFNLPEKVVNIASVLSQSIWLQDHRKGVAWWSMHVITEFSTYIAHKEKISLSNLLYYSAEEWYELFSIGRKISAVTLEQRKQFYVLYATQGSYMYIVGNKARVIAKKFSNLHSDMRIKEQFVQGVVVSRSEKKITGKIRILHSPKEVVTMKQGEILVAAMTSPDYIHAMRKASAIITDVGGLMSHAAVVSRELGIPCITGTKVATKMFKNGDIVEVDTNKGVVKKI